MTKPTLAEVITVESIDAVIIKKADTKESEK